jgi:hypothetical protein
MLSEPLGILTTGPKDIRTLLYRVDIRRANHLNGPIISIARRSAKLSSNWPPAYISDDSRREVFSKPRASPSIGSGNVLVQIQFARDSMPRKT